MEITTCKHIEQIQTALLDDIEFGTCGDCGQTIQYDGSKRPTVTKLGRLGDKLVLPNPGYKLLLDPRDEQDLASVDKAPPPLGVEVPPKPKTGGMHAVKRYYEEHKDAILHDLDTLGEEAMRKRWWKMSQVTFLGLMARWRPDYPGIPSWARDKAKRVKDTRARIKPARPRLAKRPNLDEYLEENKEAIIQDYHALPLKEFYAKWHFYSNTWTKLKKLWKVPPKPRRQGGPRIKPEAAPSVARTQRRRTQPPSDIKGLPEFPPFNVKWQSSVQEKWLETYLELSKIGRAVKED